MTEKELKKLSRKRLLEILAEQTGRENRLQRENERLKERIADREQYMSQMGDLAEAILHSSDRAKEEETALVEVAADGGTMGEERKMLVAKRLNTLRESSQSLKAAAEESARLFIARISQRTNAKH